MKEDIASHNCLLRFIKGFIVVLLVEYVIRYLVPISHGTFFCTPTKLVVRIASFGTHYVSVKDVEITEPTSHDATLFSAIQGSTLCLDISVIMSETDSEMELNEAPLRYTESFTSVPGNGCYKESMDYSSDHWCTVPSARDA